MMYTMHYDSPLGGMLLAADEEGLTGIWFDEQKYFAAELPPEHEEKTTPVLADACRWLDVYFSGKEPDFTPKLHLIGSDFRQAVWALLLKIPYGQTTTYGALAKQLAAEGGKRVSAQAVGGAVGHNPVSVIVPCHRVVGETGSLTGYAGGIGKKIRLLNLENPAAQRFYVSGTKELRTRRLILRPACEAEMEALIAQTRSIDPELSEAYAEMLAGCRAEPEMALWYTAWKVVRKEDGAFVGDMCFKGLPENGHPEIGYGIQKPYENNGYATEAARTLCKWALEQPGVMAVEAETDPDNAASQYILTTLGFVPMGIMGEEGPRFILRK